MNSNITKRKRLLSILTALMLVLAMAASVPPQEVWADSVVGTTFKVGGINYKITSDTEVTVTGTTDTGITKADLPETVTYPTSGGKQYTVTAIGDSAFLRCTGLENITIPGSVTTIGYGAFSGCTSLTSITIPEGVTTIGGSAFYNCTSLTSIKIPSSVTSIAPDAFYHCTSLAAITVAKNNLHYSVNSDGVLLNKGKTELVRYPAGKGDTVYTIPKDITSIGACAFECCQKLTAITIPDSVESIGARAFESCRNLASITIPGSIETIEAGAFNSCTALTSITIPGSVETIEAGAFNSCTALTSITIPGSVETIEADAFSGCTSLQSVTIPSSVTTIEDYAFSGCTSLASITIPNSVKTINIGAFMSIPNDATVLVVFNDATDAAKGINFGITSAITGRNINWYRGFRTFNTAANPVVLTLEQGKEYDLKQLLGITDTVYEGKEGTNPADGITIPFTLSGNTSPATRIDKDGILTIASNETGSLTIDAVGKTVTVTVKEGYQPPAVYYTLTAADLTFPDLAQGDAPSALPLSITCTGNSGTAITKVVLDSTDFLLVDSAAETYVGAGKTNDTYRIIPREGLAPGTYQAALTVTYGYGRTATAKVTLTVTKASQAPPTGLKASSKSYRSAALSWKAADRAERYQVYRAASKDGKYKLLYTTAKTETTNTGLTCGKKYYYRIRAYRTVAGKKVYSKFTAPKAVTVRPSAPSFNLKADMGKMTVTWKGVSGASGYRIYRASSKNGKYTLIRDSASKARTYTSTGLKSGRTYYYKLRAYRMVNGKKVYSAYSAIQKKTVK